jgi:hypothetical protein
MVLHPRQHKFVNLISIYASPLPPNSRVTCPSDQEPLTFKEANCFLCWNSTIRSEITVLHANGTWSLVMFEPYMNVVGCH